MVHPNSGRPQFIRAYHGCYDPLAYSILYPGGETGWKDKSILLEETPTIRFPHNRRKYTKRKTDDGHTAPSVRARTSGVRQKHVQPRTSGVRQKHVQPISQTTHSAPDLCEDEGDCDNNMAEDGEGDGGGSRLHVSAWEYYCYIMQICNGVFNIFFHGRRLF